MGRTLAQRISVECLHVLEYATIILYTYKDYIERGQTKKGGKKFY